MKMGSSPKPTPKQSLRWALEIASALAHMHEHSVQHRDMKPDNVLFASEAPDARAVVIDLGLASLNLAKSTASSAVGADMYRSLEKALGERYGPPDDLWGLGLITGGLALGESLEARVAANGGGGGGLFALNRPRVKAFIAEAIASCPLLGNLAAALLVEDPNLRPTAAAVVQSKGNTAALVRPSVGVEAIIEEEEDEDEAGGGSNKSEQAASVARLREAEVRALAAEAEMQRMREVTKWACLHGSCCYVYIRLTV